MLDVKGNIQGAKNEEIPRPRPPLELPPIEPESNYLTAFSVITAILVVVAGVGFYVLKSTKTSAYNTKQAEADDLSAELGASPLKELDLQITSLQKGLGLYQQALNGKILWSMMFKNLEKTDPKNVKFTALAMDDKQSVKLSGEGSDYTSIAKLVRSLENSDTFSDVKLVSATTSDPEKGGAINFAVTFGVKTAGLKEKAQASSVQPAGTTTVPEETANQLPDSSSPEATAPSQP